MSDPKQADLVLMGVILGAHGIKGDVTVKSFAACPADIAAYGPLKSRDGTRQFALRVVRENHKGLIVHIDGINDRTSVEALKGTELFLPRDRLPKTSVDTFYHTDLIGLSAVDPAGQKIGTVTAVQNYGAGDILEICMARDSGLELIPFTDACVPDVSLENRTLTIVFPEVSEVNPDNLDNEINSDVAADHTGTVKPGDN